MAQDLKGGVWVWFLKTLCLSVPQGKAEVWGIQINSLWGQSLSVLLHLLTKKRMEKILAWHRLAQKGAAFSRCMTRLRASQKFKLLLPQGVSEFCFCPKELVSLDPWHMTHSPPIRKDIWVGRYITRQYSFCSSHQQQDWNRPSITKAITATEVLFRFPSFLQPVIKWHLFLQARTFITIALTGSG